MNLDSTTSMTLATGAQMATVDIHKYFETVFAAEQSGQPFPVNFDDVWPMAYGRKDHAKRALLADFYEGEDFEIHHLPISGEMVNRPQGGGAQPESILLSTSCLEFFIARKVRPIFDIYRACRIEMSRQARERQEQPQPAPIALPDLSSVRLLTLAEASVASGLGRVTLRKAVTTGALVAARAGGRWRVRPIDLVLYVERLFTTQPPTRTVLALPEPSPVAEQIVAFVRMRHSWAGTASELASELGLEPTEPRGTASGLVRHISRMQIWLESQGITVAHERDAKKRTLRLRCRV